MTEGRSAAARAAARGLGGRKPGQPGSALTPALYRQYSASQLTGATECLVTPPGGIR